MYLGLVLIVMIVTGSYILISMQNTEIDKARDQLELYAQKVSEQVVESYDEADFQTGLEQFTRTSSSDSQRDGGFHSRVPAAFPQLQQFGRYDGHIRGNGL